ncbi:hypothetical protein [Paenibacillus sp. NFR01]|uniref:hypothetical protein n=1 Tax=Paenibacillus sp. NFR01 TaxID=1566279 RepID=UPI0008D58EA6|nr:hypothetical protein [Paenibacillus sp. NFR01]SEU33033.1 hypothetical protein SAMN03159358_0178 [Paenibacillus sp. NFR01]
MNKVQYFEDLKEIITDPIYQGGSENDLKDEITNNMWCLAIPMELTQEITSEDLMGFFKKVISNRQDQINIGNGTGMIFYLWFDGMANQIRFNLISDKNKELPFKCNLREVTIEEIINESLSNKKIEIITEQEIEEDMIEEFELKIYKTILTPQ